MVAIKIITVRDLPVEYQPAIRVLQYAQAECLIDRQRVCRRGRGECEEQTDEQAGEARKETHYDFPHNSIRTN
ncbi:Hypothetical protein OINT_1000411 [Brucella intermedia LMG 3301]|uniref:Uncharacterized protein n=1 Tax=Brucella intermedia LMG 3301 TaxID=641118 RepID=C4WIM6_9HYPH|nr:Hypothetical protein OINT_1000411 [Brucella intermedia LMG 3301]